MLISSIYLVVGIKSRVKTLQRIMQFLIIAGIVLLITTAAESYHAILIKSSSFIFALVIYVLIDLYLLFVIYSYYKEVQDEEGV